MPLTNRTVEDSAGTRGVSVVVVSRHGGSLLTDCLSWLDRQESKPAHVCVMAAGTEITVPAAPAQPAGRVLLIDDLDQAPAAALTVVLNERHRPAPGFLATLLQDTDGGAMRAIGSAVPFGWSSFGRALAGVTEWSGRVPPGDATVRSFVDANGPAWVAEPGHRGGTPERCVVSDAPVAALMPDGVWDGLTAAWREGAAFGHPAALGVLVVATGAVSRRARAPIGVALAASVVAVSLRVGSSGSIAPHRAALAFGVRVAGLGVGGVARLLSRDSRS